MKKIYRTAFSLLLATLFIPQILFSQWTDMGEYKELKATTAGITQLLVPDGENYFCIADDSHTLFRFDYGGNQIFKKQIPPLKNPNFNFIRFSDDGKSYNAYAIAGVPSTGDGYGFYFQALNIENDSMIFQKKSFQYTSGFYGDFYGFNYFGDFNEKMGTALLYGDYAWFYQHGGSHYEDDAGNISFYSNDTDTINLIMDRGVQQVTYSKNYVYQAFISFYDDCSYWYDMQTGQHTMDFGSYDQEFIFYNSITHKSFSLAQDLQNCSNHTQTVTGFLPDSFRIANNDSVFIATLGSTLYKYKFNQDTVWFSDSFTLPYQFKNLIYSPDDRFYIVATPKQTIDIYQINSKMMVKQYLLKDNLDAVYLANTQDGKGFLTTNEKGIVNYFQPEFFTDSLKAFFISDSQHKLVFKNFQFYNYSTGNPDRFLWYFGDGDTSTEENPVHQYSTAGSYSVKLIIFKSSNSDTLEKIDYIKIDPLLQANFDADVKMGNPPLSVNFTDKSIGNIVSRQWDFGDSSFSSDLSPSHIYITSGVYPVRLIVSDGVFYDTLLKKNYVVVNQSPITDSIILKEHIDWSFDKDMEGITGYQTPDGGYITESSTEGKNFIMRFDRNFDTLWVRSLYQNIINRPLQLTPNGTIYVMGSTVQNNDTFSLNRVNDKGDIKRCFSYEYQTSIHAFDFLPDDYSYIIILPDSNYYGASLIINKYNSIDSLIKTEAVLSQPIYSSIYSFLSTYKNDSSNNILIKINAWLTYSYYNHQHLFILDKNNLSLNHIIFLDTLRSYKYFTDFKMIGNNNFSFIEDRRYLNFYNSKGLQDWSKKFTNATYLSLLDLTDSTFVIAGSKDGYCWFAVMDTNGNTLDEHVLTNRKGSFNHVSLNKDGSLFFVGSLYKNSFNGIAEKNSKEKIQQTGDIHTLYLMQTKPVVKPTFVESPSNELKLSVYPNPADNQLTFECSLPEIQPIYLTIFDNLGNTLQKIETQQRKIEIDLSGYSTGMYFYRIQSESLFKKGKFVVVK